MLDILHLTDLHLHADPDYQLMGVNTRESLENVLLHVEQNQRKPDLILITGDLTHDETTGGYERLKSILNKLQTPIYLLPGNHDMPALMQQAMPGEWISTQQQILFDTWQIIMLDSTIKNSEAGEVSETQMNFLSTCLSQHSNRNTLVCLHHQPVAIGSRWLDTMRLANSTQFIEFIQKHEQIKAVLWGHVHQEFNSQIGHIQLLSSPATCKQFKPLSDDFAIDKQKTAGYRWLTLQDTGGIDTQVVWCT